MSIGEFSFVVVRVHVHVGVLVLALALAFASMLSIDANSIASSVVRHCLIACLIVV